MLSAILITWVRCLCLNKISNSNECFNMGSQCIFFNKSENADLTLTDKVPHCTIAFELIHDMFYLASTWNGFFSK